MNRPTPLSTLQKTYDDAHLVCSTAIYFESRSNESEALRCWRNALDQLNYNKLYRIPGAWRASNEVEKELVTALLGLERQARERISLLEALELSRKDAGVASDGHGLGDGTVKPLAMDDLVGPPSLPNRPMPPREPSSQSFTHTSIPKDGSRSPSPDKKPKMRSTLRSSAKSARSSSSKSGNQRGGPQGASKAATLAWTTKNGSPVLVDAQGLRNPTFEVHPRLRAARVRSISPPPSRDSTAAVVNQPRAHDTAFDDPLMNDRHRVGQMYSVDADNSRQALSRASAKASHTTARPVRTSVPNGSREKSNHNRGQAHSTTEPSSSETGRDLSARVSGRIGNSASRASEIRRRPVQQVSANSSKTRAGPEELQRQVAGIDLENSLSDSESTAEEESEEETWFETSARILDNLPRGVDHHAAEQILNEVIIQGDEVHWDDIAGLEIAKAALKENVVYPFLRPDLFRGLREPARGILLFGPPGTGKTMLARAVATESKSTFFAVSASSLISKFLGESEKLVRALFSLAKLMAPSVIFVDEIDSLLSSRSDQGEHETSRRIKTEFLIQWSDLARAAAGRDAKAGDAGRVLVLAATNAPWAIDDAARRRFVRRQYIPLPEGPVRAAQIQTLLAEQKHDLSDRDVKRLIERTQDFSGSDITALAKDAAMGPLRSLGDRLLLTKPDEIRPISIKDFEASLQTIRPSVNKAGLQQFDDWAKEYGERGG